MIPDSLNQLIESFKILPGVGEKSAERYAYAILDLDEDLVSQFASSVENIKDSIQRCSICNSITDKNICSICSDKTRENNALFVVDDPKNVFLFEKLNMFNGKYHVLNGLIDPLEGINPEDIGIDSLIKRIEDEDFKEIIFALKPSIEGETTSLYIKKILDGMNVKITRLASGVPIGADMEYIDSLTLERALSDRKEV
jgi:recombination protein RecR